MNSWIDHWLEEEESWLVHLPGKEVEIMCISLNPTLVDGTFIVQESVV